MPRKFKDGELVHVWYSTRQNTLQFIGRVIDFIDKKYKVMYLFPDYLAQSKYSNFNADSFRSSSPDFSYDMVFKCHSYEMSRGTANFPEYYEHTSAFPYGEITDDGKKIIIDCLMQTYFQYLKREFSGWHTRLGIHNFNETQLNRQTHKSFTTKRAQDWALNRVFPVVEYPPRARYLYV